MSEHADSTKRGLPALVFNGQVIHDRNKMLSLTDMWKAAGSPKNREPFNWSRFEGAPFVEAVALAHNLSDAQVMVTKKGKGGGTWGHWQAALGYAKYLNPDFHMWCNDVVRERMEGVPASVSAALTKQEHGGITKKVVRAALGDMMPGILFEALALVLPDLVTNHLEADSRAVAIGYMPALAVLIDKKVPTRRRRAFSQKVSARLRRFSTAKGHPIRISRETGRYLFHVDAINAWLAAEGEILIREHVAGLNGQGVLRLVQS